MTPEQGKKLKKDLREIWDNWQDDPNSTEEDLFQLLEYRVIEELVTKKRE